MSNREIKFRVWDGKEMREPPPLHEWDMEDGEFWVSYCDNPIVQFTGLKDKNGREIYEGDILKLMIEDVPYPFTVIWEHDHMRFGLKDHEGEIEHDSWAFTPHNDFEVIGNIHENPELLK